MTFRLFLSRTGEDEADIIWDDADQSLALGGITYEFAQRIVACVNACADIPTESLVSMNWQLAPVVGAKPLDMAKLILRMNEYREAITKLIDQVQRCSFIDEEGHLLTMNKAYRDLEGLLS